MKQRMRRISALLLVVLMCVSMVVPAFAADSAECPAVHTKSNCSYGDPIDVVEADCGQQGYTVYQCNDCGVYFAADIVESLGDHEYSILMKDPTCTENGYTKVVCYNCDEVLYETLVPALNHMIDGESAMEGPCDAQKCALCGYVGEAGDNGHNWGEPELKKVPTHAEQTNGSITVTDGSAEVKCLDCGKTKTVPVSCLKEHTWVTYERVDATCTTTGTTEGKKCSGCGKVAKLDNQTTEPLTTIEKIACIKENKPTIVAPTCEETGSYSVLCTMCKKPVNDVITLAPLGHNFQTKIYKIDENGLTDLEILVYEAMAVEGLENYITSKYKMTVLLPDEDTGDLVETTLSMETLESILGRMTDVDAYLANATGTRYSWTGDFLTVPSSIEWAQDCTTEQTIYNFNCTKCGGGLPAEQLPIGHIWEYSHTVEPDCENGEDGKKVYVCANPNCSGVGEADKNSTTVTYEEDQDGNAVKNEILKANHNYKEVVVAPTCKKQGYKYEYCTGCEAEKSVNADNSAREKIDDHFVYDVVPADPTAHVPTDKIVTPAGCVTNGSKDIICGEENCTYQFETNVVIPATGHTYDPTSEPDYPITEATCTKPAVKAWDCEVCGQKAELEFGNALGHSFEVQVIAPSCVGETDGYTISVCKNGTCRVPNPQNPGKTNVVKFDKNYPAHHTAVRITDTKVGDCVTPTLNYYECSACKDNVTGTSYKFSAYDETTGTGHTLTDIPEVPATCVNDGVKAHKYCSVCKINTLDGTTAASAADLKIAKLSEDGVHNVKSLTIVPAVAPTCTTDGNYIGYKCADCGAFATEDGTADNNANRVIPKFNHKLPDGSSAYGLDLTYKFNTRVADCENWGYDFLECALCGDEKIVNYKPDFGGHTLSDEVEEVEATCSSFGVKAHKFCTVAGCGFLTIDGETAVTAEDLIIAKVAHVNEDEVEFWGTCVEAEDEDFDFFCTVCDEEIVADHEYAVTKVPATCQEYSYELWVCVHCKDNFVTNKGFTYSDNHVAWGDWVVEEPATTTEPGLKVRVCACGAKEEVEIPALSGIEFTFEVENAICEGAEFTNSGLIALSIKTNASNLDVWAIRLTVHYDATLVSNAKKFDSLNSKFADIQVNYDDVNGVATVVAYASVTNSSNITLDGEENLATLYFRIKPDAVVGADAYFSMGGNNDVLEVVDKDNNVIDMVAADDVYAEVEATLGYVTVDNVIDITDAKALMFYITGEADDVYCSAADIDLDGEVTLADFALMQQYLLGTLTEAKLAVAFDSETATAPEA